MALITEDQGFIDKSLEYHQLVLQKRIEEKDSSSIGSTFNNMGSVYWRLNKMDSSLLLFQKAYEIRKALGQKRGARESLSNIAYILNEQGKPKEAMPLIKQTLALAREMNDLNGIINTSETLGNVYVNLNQLDSAEQIYLQVLPLAEQVGINKRIILIHQQLAGLYERKKDFRKAYFHLNTYWTLKDSIEGQEAASRLSKLQAQYDSEKQKSEIIQLQQQNQISRSWQNIYALGSISALVLALLVFLFYRYRQRKNEELLEAKDLQTRQLEDINQMKSRFLANISHELRTPLTMIIGPTKDLLSQAVEEAEKQQLNWIHNNSRKLLKLINQLLDLSKIEAGKLELKASQQDLVQFCRYLISAFESLAAQKKLRLTYKATLDEMYVYFDPEKLEQVINNLLYNAFKFTDEGLVSVQVEEVEEDGQVFARICVSDSGKGIHSQQLPYIFDRFYQADQESPDGLAGTGIGLSLCKELIELHRGKIRVESELEKGSQFFIYLPLGRSHLKDKEVSLTRDRLPKQNPILPEVTQSEEKAAIKESSLPLVLLIDDNQDILDYIQLQLKTHFQFIIANNGQTGLEMAQKNLPDLIISDVMMPGMNGFEVCEKLKRGYYH